MSQSSTKKATTATKTTKTPVAKTTTSETVKQVPIQTALTLTKDIFVKELASKHSITQQKALEIVDSMSQIFQENLNQNKVVTLWGIGRFKPYTKAARVSRNPKTQEKVNVPAKQTVKFVPAKELLDNFNNQN